MESSRPEASAASPSSTPRQRQIKRRAASSLGQIPPGWPATPALFSTQVPALRRRLGGHLAGTTHTHCTCTLQAYDTLQTHCMQCMSVCSARTVCMCSACEVQCVCVVPARCTYDTLLQTHYTTLQYVQYT